MAQQGFEEVLRIVIEQQGDTEIGRLAASLLEAGKAGKLAAADVEKFAGQLADVSAQAQQTDALRATAAAELAAGPMAGARLGYWPSATIGGEVELAAVAGRYAGIDGAATLASVRAHLAVRRQGRHLGGRLLLGVGADTLLASARSTSDNALLVDLGAAGTFTTDSGLTLRLDLRDVISRADGGERAHGLEATLGLLVPFH